jgi:DNA-nicking Smr family endonuclease
MAGKRRDNLRDNPFAALATLQQTPPAPAQVTVRDKAPPAPPAPPPPADDIDFRRAIGTVTRITASDRAELTPPRPAPVPRPRRKHEAEDDAPVSPAPGARLDPLTEAYAGVTRLRASDRAEEIGLPRRYHTRPLAAEMDATLGTLSARTGVILPPLDTNDPVTLFRAAIGDTRPLTASARLEINAPRPLPVPRQRQLDEEAALAESLVQGLGFEDRLDSGEEDAFLRPGLSRRVLTDLRRGRWTPQDKVDLHGFNRDEARAALSHFLATALTQGKRCIRVIHGKGLGSPGGVSILKQLSRSWLAQREEILAFCQANPHEGGAGALLVLLRAPSSRRT